MLCRSPRFGPLFGVLRCRRPYFLPYFLGLLVLLFCLLFRPFEKNINPTFSPISIYKPQKRCLMAEPFDVTLKTLTGRTCVLHLPNGSATTVLTLKRIIQDKEGYDPEQQRLICGGVRLAPDNATLDNFAVRAGSEFHMVLNRCFGCGATWPTARPAKQPRSPTMGSGALRKRVSREIELCRRAGFMVANEEGLDALCVGFRLPAQSVVAPMRLCILAFDFP